jgi:hypothetical protein
MEILDCEHYKPMEVALMEIGLKIDKVVKQRKKTVIIVSRNVKREKKLIAASKKA